MPVRTCCMLILLLTPLMSSAQSRRSSNSRAQDNIPGVFVRSPEMIAPLRKRLQKAIDDREDLQKKAISEARKLLRKYNSDPAADDADQLAAKAGFLFAYGGDWKNADSTFEALNESHPESVWNYEGQLCRFDIAAEHRLDLAAMKDIVTPLVPWARSQTAEKTPGPTVVALGQNRTSSLRELPIQYPGPPIVKKAEDGFEIAQRNAASIAADILHRAGLVCWLNEELPQAKEFFQQAIELDPKLGNHIVRLGTSMTYKTQFRPSPVDFQDREDDIDKLILLADVYANGQQVYRINRLWENILKQRKNDLSKSQRSYIEMRRSLSQSNLTSPLEKQPEDVIEGYLTAQKLDPDAPWADLALYLAGTAAWNLSRDYEQAIVLYQKQLDEYEDRHLAPHAAYRSGIVYERLKKWKEAKAMYDLVLEEYPESGLEKLAEDHLRKLRRYVR